MVIKSVYKVIKSVKSIPLRRVKRDYAGQVKFVKFAHYSRGRVALARRNMSLVELKMRQAPGWEVMLTETGTKCIL